MADEPIAVPAHFPAETHKSEAVNGHQSRFSDTAIHDHLHSNITASLMSYTQEPFPNVLSDRIVESYAGLFEQGGHDKLLELNTTVEKAEKLNGEWVLTLRKELPTSNYWWQETFDALVVATGHYNPPWLPDIPGLVEFDTRFPGKVVHSKHFRTAAAFQGKKVIVVGGSVSAHEIAHEILSEVQHPLYVSLRSGPAPAFVSTPFDHPYIKVVKQIAKFDAASGTITLADGTVLNDVGNIIFATSYTFSIPFLPHVQDRICRGYRRLPGVYQHTWDIEDDSLAFIGMLGGGFTFRAYEWQAVAVARRLAGRGNALPSKDDQRAWERKRVQELVGGKAYYSIAPGYKEYLEFLRNVAGDPAPGTTGRVLLPFDDNWLATWEKMPLVKIQRWKALADEARRDDFQAKL